MRIPDLLFFVLGCIGSLGSVALAQSPVPPAPPTVQDVLARWAAVNPDKFGQVAESGRYYLLEAKPDLTPEALQLELQEAFYREYAPVCQQYGQRYLLSWRLLLAKAARETFWGASQLCNRGQNYFGIRTASKPWICEQFRYCGTLNYYDPDYAAFATFPNFEASLWMFIHTIYSGHYLARYPDLGNRVFAAIAFERRTGNPYWVPTRDDYFYATQLPGDPYTQAETIYTWSEHPINNLCTACDRASDHRWLDKLSTVEMRVYQMPTPSGEATMASGRKGLTSSRILRNAFPSRTAGSFPGPAPGSSSAGKWHRDI